MHCCCLVTVSHYSRPPVLRSDELDGSAEKRRLNYDPWWRIVSTVTELSMVLKHTAHTVVEVFVSAHYKDGQHYFNIQAYLSETSDC